MAIRFENCILQVAQDAPCFVVGTNRTNFFEIGDEKSTRYWLRGQIVGSPPEFTFSGRIFIPGVVEPGVIFDNFPKGPVPRGWVRKQRIGTEGYDLVDQTGTIHLFGYEVDGNICRVCTTVYDERGGVVAETAGDAFLIRSSTARIGGSF